MHVVWSPAALREIDRVFDYLADFNPHAAQRVADGSIAAGESLALFPHRGRAVPGTNRRELITAYPYITRYRVMRNAVRILRVRHTSRRPTDP